MADKNVKPIRTVKTPIGSTIHIVRSPNKATRGAAGDVLRRPTVSKKGDK